MLRKELKEGQHGNWEEILGEVCFAYRTSVHSSTLETPYYLVHGRDPNVPINLFLDANPEPVPSATDYIGNMVNRLRFSFQKAKIENEKARERQRIQYNKRAIINEYKTGDRVLLDVRIVAQGDSRKFTSKFKGPYRIVKVYNNNTVDIADSAYHIQKVHVNRLKPLFETMLWKDETCPPIFPTEKEKDKFKKSIATQTIDEETNSSQTHEVNKEIERNTEIVENTPEIQVEANTFSPIPTSVENTPLKQLDTHTIPLNPDGNVNTTPSPVLYTHHEVECRTNDTVATRFNLRTRANLKPPNKPSEEGYKYQ